MSSISKHREDTSHFLEDFCMKSSIPDDEIKSQEKFEHHLTRIMCTIGPASKDPKILEDLTLNGMDVARINMSHGTYSDYIQIINDLHNIWNNLSRTTENFYPRAIAIDLCGPEIRTGILQTGPDTEIKLEQDGMIALTTNVEFSKMCGKDIIYIDYDILKIVKVNHHIHINNSEIILQVLEISYDTLICKIIRAGILKSKLHVRLSEVSIELNELLDKDKNNLKFAVDYNINYVFASLINCPDDILRIREYLNSFGTSGTKIKIIAKIQTYLSVKNIDDLINISDAIHFSRDSLCDVMPAKHIFSIQKCIMAKCLKAGKPILYTTCLNSMKSNPRPLISEIFDIANAILDGSSSLVIKIETSLGKYPVESVCWVVKICKNVEKQQTFSKSDSILKNSVRNIQNKKIDSSDLCAFATIDAHMKCEAVATFIISKNKNTANIISNLRPNGLIFAIFRNEQDCRQTTILRSVWPLIYQETFDQNNINPLKDVENQLNFGIQVAKKLRFVQNGDPIIVAISMDNNVPIQMVRLMYACVKNEL